MVGASSNSDGAQGGAGLATAPKNRTRERRNNSHLVFQRMHRFWVYMHSGKADVILTDQLPAASMKEMQSRGLLSSRQGWTGGRGTWAPAPHAGQPLRAGYFIFGL